MYETRNHLMICSEYSDPVVHRHSAAHIIISLNDSIEVVAEDTTITCEGILIPSGVAHTAKTHGSPVLVFLFDKTTSVCNQILSVRTMTDDNVCKIRNAFRKFEFSYKDASCYEEFAQIVFECSGITTIQAIIIDERIEKALTYIQTRLHEKITCSDVAESVFLSESRFSHLFRDEVGMTFAAYLIYQRVIQTYTDIIKGRTVTHAALDAGFSSAAHFAEVNKRLFGLSATGIKKELQFYKIAEI